MAEPADIGAWRRVLPRRSITRYSIRVDSAGRDFNQVADAKLSAGQEVYAKIVSLRSWLGDDNDCTNWGGCDTLYVWLIRPEEARPAIGKSPFYGGN